MNKFDIVLRFRISDLFFSFFNAQDPYQLIKKELEIDNNLNTNYYSWGRNAVFDFFKNSPFSNIGLPAFTCPILIKAIENAGKKVTLIDADLETFNLDLIKIPNDIDCLFTVHTFGNPINIDLIKKTHKDLFIFEDCAHALFAKVNNTYVGGKGDAVLFSLYKQVANINGSILLTSNKELRKSESLIKNIKRIILKTNGWHQKIINDKRKNYLPGIESQIRNNFQPTSIALNLFNLGFKKLKSEVEIKNKLSLYYLEECLKNPYFIAQKVLPGYNSSYCYFAIRLNPDLAHLRDKILYNLRQKNIFLAALWPDSPATRLEYRKLFPNALLLSKTVINLPISSNYTQGDIKNLFKEINNTIKDLT